MKQASIFEGVVRGEDSHTNLLRNLMLADAPYGMAVCELLRPTGFNLQFTELPDIQTQVTLATPGLNHGRADMLIESGSAVLLVEVKTALYCDLTDNQDFGLDDQGKPKLKGYVSYLKYRQQQGAYVGLSLLAPRSWVHRETIRRQLAQLDIPTQSRTWEQVCTLSLNPHFGKLAGEFGAFLENDFMDISFAPEEVSLLTSELGLKAFGSASLKLHELVKQAEKELKSILNTSAATGFEVRDLWGDAKEHGAVVYHNGKRALWFGTWSEAGSPLVAGFDERWAVEATQLDFSGLSPVPKRVRQWTTFQLPKECFTGSEPLLNLVLALRRILRI
jgi:hypothetical protein